MMIAALQKVSLIDFPGKVSAVLFTQGCNARCGYCHNPQLVMPEQFTEPLSELELISFLQSRTGKLDGVVITGGEPTLHDDLPRFIGLVKAMGFLVKLDTNGTNPAMLKQLLDSGMLDFIAMDIKGSKAQYSGIVRVYLNPENIQESVTLIKDSGLPAVFRTTIVKGIHTPETIAAAEQDFSVSLHLQQFIYHANLVGKGFSPEYQFTKPELQRFGQHFLPHTDF